jgi:hypothetical protein
MDVRALFDQIRKFDTPTICNALEVVRGKRFTNGFTRQRLIAAFPKMLFPLLVVMPGLIDVHFHVYSISLNMYLLDNMTMPMKVAPWPPSPTPLPASSGGALPMPTPSSSIVMTRRSST